MASTGGITFALLLMLLQLGFRNALLDSSVEQLRRLDADIIVINKGKHPFLARDRMPAERLYQALSVPGVASAAPVWMSLEQWKNLEQNTLHPIRVIGFDPEKPTFLIDAVNENAEKLKRKGTALIDKLSRDSYGRLEAGPAQVSRHQIEIVGTFALGTDFEVDGSLLVSDETYFELTHDGSREVEAALLKLEKGANPAKVLTTLSEILPGDVRAYAKESLIEDNLRYWEQGTPISIFLLVGVALGFGVGIAICYQILYTEVIDHLVEFATLKAMGYSDRYIKLVVIAEAAQLSMLGFIPSIVLGGVLLAGLGISSGLPASLSLGDILGVGLLSFGMCTLAGMLALRNIQRLEPAELF